MVLRRDERANRGYSLIEALIAAAVLAVIAIGILPFFIQAMVNNRQGADSTIVTTYSRTGVEDLLAVPFDAAAVTIPAGSTSTVVTDWYVQSTSKQIGGTSGKWVTSATAPTGMGQVLWQRTATVQQFNVTDLALTTPLDGSTSSDFVHLKQIQVVVQRVGGGNGLTAGKTIKLQLLRAD